MALQIMTPAGRLGPYDSVEALADRWIVDGAAVLRSAVGGEGVVGEYEWGVGDAPQVPELEPPAPEVPQVVTMRQARLALLGAGLLDDVDAAINSLPSPQKEAARIEWEYAAEVQRNSGLVSGLGEALGLDAAGLDALFVEASKL